MTWLHVIEEGWAATEALAGARAFASHHPCDVLLLGGSSLERRASELGVPTTDRIAPPGRLPCFAVSGLRNYLSDRGRPDKVFCWSTGAAKAIERADRRLAPILMETCIGSSPRGGRLRWPRPAAERRTAERVRWRAALGVGDDELLVVPLASADSAIDVWKFQYIFSLLETAGVEVAAVAPRAGRRVRRARRSQRMGLRPLCLRWTKVPLARAVESADLGVWLAESVTPRWSITTAQSAGIPVLCERVAGIEGVLPPCGGCAVAPGVPTEMARVIMELADDPTRLQDLSRRAAEHASDPRALDAIRRSIRSLEEG